MTGRPLDDLVPRAQSVASFSTDNLPAKTPARYAWSANEQVTKDAFLRMKEEWTQSKERQLELEAKCKQLSAQLARTEEAAKRALVKGDVTAKGGAAQKLLDAERTVQQLREENTELQGKLSREKKRAIDCKHAADEAKKRLDAVLADQRKLVRKVGELETANKLLRMKPTDKYWSEEAGRRYAEDFNRLRDKIDELTEENERLKKLAEDDGPAAAVERYESQIREMAQLVKYYERQLNNMSTHTAEIVDDNAVTSAAPWVLEEFHHQDELYLLDRTTGKLFTMPGDQQHPRPIGVKTPKGVQLGSGNNMDRFLRTLDEYLGSSQSRLEQVFREFDLDNSGQLDRRELSRMLQKIMPELNPREVEELRTMLDVDGDGLITYAELVDSIRQVVEARAAARMGKSIAVNDRLERVRDALRNNRKLAEQAFEEMDSDKDGCLQHLDVIKLVRKFVPDLAQTELRYLLARLQEWDVHGEGKLSCAELYQALELVQWSKPGMATTMRYPSPGRTMSPSRTTMQHKMGNDTTMRPATAAGSTIPAFRPATKSPERSGVGAGMKEAFLRERVEQLERELRSLQKEQGPLAEQARKAEEMVADLARYKARIEELERDFMKIDVLGQMEGGGLDDQLRKAWEVASQFKKRFLEHKSELDALKVVHTRAHLQLEETTRLLREQHSKTFQLENDNTALQVEVMRLKELEARLQHERSERLKLEREYLSLQQKALAAPGSSLAEVRQLQEEGFKLRREKAVAEQKEAEVRRELSHVREQLDGMSVDQYRAMQHEFQELRKRVATQQLELQAALDKLEVYRRTEGISNAVPHGLGGMDTAGSNSLYSDRRPDQDKNEDEVRRELAQLRDVWRLDQAEITKLHAVLENEGQQTQAAKAALEEAQREMAHARREMQEQLRSLQRELDRRDEKVRKLELQLRGAYSGINRALRSDRVRDSRALSDAEDMSEVGDDQNIFELHISEATLYEEQLGKDPSTFVSVDFFMHETQATPVLASNAPAYNTTVQYVVDNDTFMVEYMDTHMLELELCRAKGWDYDTIGVARVALKQVLEDLEIGAALGHNRAYHYVDIHGANGQRIGRLRYGYSFRRPVDALVREYRLMLRSKRLSQPDARDPATVAVQLAQAQPQAACHVKVVVERCEQLVALGHPDALQPYVHYRFPGHRDYHDTRMGHGINPVFDDEATWITARTPDLEANLRTREMQFVVFDDANGADPMHSIIGVAMVPLIGLAQGMPVEGAFKLVHPVSKRPAGRIILGLGWHNVLQLPSQPLAGKGLRPPIPHAPLEQASGAYAGGNLEGGGMTATHPHPAAVAPTRQPAYGLGSELLDAEPGANPSAISMVTGGYGLQAETASLASQHQHGHGHLAQDPGSGAPRPPLSATTAQQHVQLPTQLGPHLPAGGAMLAGGVPHVVGASRPPPHRFGQPTMPAAPTYGLQAETDPFGAAGYTHSFPPSSVQYQPPATTQLREEQFGLGADLAAQSADAPSASGRLLGSMASLRYQSLAATSGSGHRYQDMHQSVDAGY